MVWGSLARPRLPSTGVTHLGPIKEEEVTPSNDTTRDNTEHYVADATVREKAVIREGGGRGQGGGGGGGRGQGKEAINGMPSKKSNSTSQLSAEGLLLLLLCSSL